MLDVQKYPSVAAVAVDVAALGGGGRAGCRRKALLIRACNYNKSLLLL